MFGKKSPERYDAYNYACDVCGTKWPPFKSQADLRRVRDQHLKVKHQRERGPSW